MESTDANTGRSMQKWEIFIETGMYPRLAESFEPDFFLVRVGTWAAYCPIEVEPGAPGGGATVFSMVEPGGSPPFVTPAGPDGTPVAALIGADASTILRIAPGESRIAPSTTTRSPGSRPWLMNQPSPCQSPISTSRRAALPSPSTTQT